MIRLFYFSRGQNILLIDEPYFNDWQLLANDRKINYKRNLSQLRNF